MRLLIFLLLPLFSFAQIDRPVGQRYSLANQPMISSSVQFLSFTATQGTASTAQSVVFSGVSGTITVSEASDDFEISLTSGSGYTTSVSGASPLTVYVRTRSAATAGIKQNMLTASFSGADNKYVGLFADISESVAKQTIRINFSRTEKSVAGHVNVFGHVGPANGSVKTASADGITVSTVATGNWGNLSGNTAYDGFGVLNGTFFTAGNGTENAVMRNQVVNNNAYNSAAHQFLVSGLNTGSTYTVKATGSVNQGSASGRTTGMRWQGSGAISSEYTYNPGGSGTMNTSDGTTFVITPDASGQVKLWMYAGTGSTPGVLCGLTIEEN